MLKIRDQIQAEVDAAATALRAFDHLRGPNGLTPDAVKATQEWKTARANYQAAFSKLRKINSLINRGK